MAEVTIGIPFYNCEDTLANTIRSLFAQSFQDWELVLVDDGSTDSSLSIARSIDDVRVHVIADGINKGIGARRKQIVDLADGKYLAWQDADDMMHPDRLRVQYDFLEKHSEIDIVDTSYFTIDPKHNILRLLKKVEGYVDNTEMARFPSLTNGTSMARIEIYKKFPYDERLRRGEDWDVWLKALGNAKYYHIEDTLYYRMDADINQKPRISRELIGPRYNAKIYMRYGWKYLGLLTTLKLIIRLYARTAFRLVLISTGQHKRFKVEKTNALTPKTKVLAEQGIKEILEIAVPGFHLLKQN